MARIPPLQPIPPVAPLEENITAGVRVYKIKVEFDDELTGNINDLRNHLFDEGGAAVEVNFPSIYVFTITTRRLGGVMDFLLRCGVQVHRRTTRFTGQYSLVRGNQGLNNSLFLNVPEYNRGGIDEVRSQMLRVAQETDWNVAGDPPIEHPINGEIYAPRVRLCDFNNHNLDVLTDEISRHPNLPFVGSVIRCTADEHDDGVMPVATFIPEYNTEGGPHNNLQGGPANQQVWY